MPFSRGLKEDNVASCSITYSSAVAERAARQFFWLRWRTPFGILFFSSIVIVTGVLIAWICFVGPDWFAGMLGTLLAANLLIHWTWYSRFPKALARSIAERKSAELETTGEGMRLSFGQNTNFTPWSRFSAIWIYDEFILLRLGKSQWGSLFIHIPTRDMTPEVRSTFEGARDRLG